MSVLRARIAAGLVVVSVLGLLNGCGEGSSVDAVGTAGSTAGGKVEVLLVGNNWDGTADIISVPGYQNLKRINIVPDLEERKAEIYLNPVRLGYYLAIRQLIGEGHDQLVDDLFASKDGRTLFVSRPSLADVVAIDIDSGEILWRTPVAGQRSDHMAISPDGTRLAVSASTANVVHMIDTATGKIVGEFESGDSPHENNYSHDGKRIFHASIGTVYTPLDSPLMSTTKGDRYFQIVDAETLQVLRRIDMGQKLAEAGYPDMSSAVRPMAISPDERFVYVQVSFFHGFVEYDLETDKVTRVAELPLSEKAAGLRRDEYLLDSAHHGLAMNGAGTKLCVAGTMSDYAAIVSRDTFEYTLHPLGATTYWATSSQDGKYCYVSVAGDDTISVISYDSEKEVARFPVGDHPQRARTAQLDRTLFD
ncbi:YncE family protein [Sinimarinibacterium sp. CAU 1509]|uniref:YncE family protein n=1 Tax=Sinimarinibacterium sp. CAU 1509 TaxID=2562283 RepID=UPI001B7FCAA7|nr:PQQ-binding-like beta-propeller repeat protein [Sinimarinibacterium sp. CAU 1509]